jgi:PAS domain S-box-containing protein
MATTELGRPKGDLLGISFDITVLGVILTVIMTMTERRIDAAQVVTVCMFLSATFVWKLIWPLKKWTVYTTWQLFAMCMVIGFSWWLVYQAEGTRAGWYRFNVLQRRVHNFVQHAPAYVVMADENGIITCTSENIDALTGYKQSELVGQPVTVIMRDAPAAKHLVAYAKAVQLLRNDESSDSGWTLQGLLTIGVKRKDGNIVPVRAYAGGIRWSTDIQFAGDIDTFAVFVPVSESQINREIKAGESTITEDDAVKVAPPPKPANPL